MTWTLHHGDCLAGMAALPDKSVDVCLTDPPYEAEAHTKQRRIVDPRRQVIREAPLSFGAITAAERDAAAGHFARLAKRWIVVFCQTEATHLWRASLEAHGARYVRTGIFIKPNGQPQLTGDRPGCGFESVVIAYGSAGRMRWNGGGRHAVWTHAVKANFSREARLHETEKPLPLMLDLVRDFTDAGETVLDPFAGSGTTGAACIRLGRSFIGWERDTRYHALATARLSATREQGELFGGRGPRPRQAVLLP